MSAENDDRKAEEAAYLSVLENFTDWCVERGLPFKWAMMQAIWSYQRDFKGEEVQQFPLLPAAGKARDGD